jgi:hypothetical protein
MDRNIILKWASETEVSEDGRCNPSTQFDVDVMLGIKFLHLQFNVYRTFGRKLNFFGL